MAGGFIGLTELTGVWFSSKASFLNTRQERFSMMNFYDGTHIIMTQEVDGAVGKPDRATLLDLYCGIPLGAPGPPVTGGAGYIPWMRRRREF